MSTVIMRSSRGFYLGSTNARESSYFADVGAAGAALHAWEKTPTRPYSIGHGYQMAMALGVDSAFILPDATDVLELSDMDVEFLYYLGDHPEFWTFFTGRAERIWWPGARTGFAVMVGQLRWQSLLRSKRRKSTDDYFFNDKFQGRYARLLVTENPEWHDLFEFRGIRV